jgi:sialic acid synthase
MFENLEEPFVIAEVGQNHNGDLSLALEYIKIFAAEGADAVKFQTRNNKYLFSKEAYEASYNSENAYAQTYGEHRERLELKPEWLPILREACAEHKVKFMVTPFDEPSLELLNEVGVDIFKIASFDLGNLPFISRIAKTGRPIVMSVGGGKIEQIRASVDLILSQGSELAVLHCVSEYPCDYNRLGLDNIEILIKEFPKCVIGSSDHFNGILSGPVAYLKGARIFEKHVTLNRAVRHMLPSKPSEDLGAESVFKKLGKSITAYTDLKAGQIIEMENVTGRIFQKEIIPVREAHKIIGMKINKDIPSGFPIHLKDLADKND